MLRLVLAVHEADGDDKLPEEILDFHTLPGWRPARSAAACVRRGKAGISTDALQPGTQVHPCEIRAQPAM